MTSNAPKVSFVTVNYRSAQLLRHLLKSIEEAKLPFVFEYFVVDCDRKDGLATIMQDFPWAQYRDAGGNLGFGRGNNLVLPELRGEYVAFINPDVMIFPQEIERWVAFMDANPDIGLSGPRTVNPDGSDQLNCYRFPSLLIPVYRRTPLGLLPWAKKASQRFTMQDMDREKTQDVDWMMGSALMIRRSLLNEIGGFDDRYFMYFEDTDLCRSVWSKGYRVTYFAETKLMHYHKRESRITNPFDLFKNRVAREHIKSGFRYFLKYRNQANPRVS